MDVYYNPEKFGLQLVGEIEFEGGYEHDKIAVWRKEDGTFLYGESAGCSCIGIFDGMGIDDLTPVSPQDFLIFAGTKVEEKAQYRSWGREDFKDRWQPAVVELFERMVKP